MSDKHLTALGFTANMFGALLVLPSLARFLTKRSDGTRPV